MKISRLPAAAIDRLLLLDSHATVLARVAALAESAVTGARTLMNSHDRVDPASALRARNEFPQTLKRAQDARQRADAAMRTASGAKAFVDLLPDSAEVAVCEPSQSNGIDLSECRSKIAELRAEITRIKSLAAPADRELLEGFVDEIRKPAEAEVAGMLRRWPHFCSPEHIRMGNDADVILALTIAMCPRDAMVKYICDGVDAIADAAMPPSERAEKIAALESELVALQAIEVTYVNTAISAGATDVAHSADAPPWIVLGISVVERERLAS